MVFQHGDVSLSCFKAQWIKFYNLAEVGVEVGGRVLFRWNPYHFKDKNCVEVRLAARSAMMLAAEVAKLLSLLLLRRLSISG